MKSLVSCDCYCPISVRCMCVSVYVSVYVFVSVSVSLRVCDTVCVRVCVCVCVMLMLTLKTLKSSLIPLIKGLCCSNPSGFEFSVFGFFCRKILFKEFSSWSKISSCRTSRWAQPAESVVTNMYTGVVRHPCSVHICICTGALKSRFNAFNACHTHHNKCTHTRTCTPMVEWSSNLFERFIYSVFTKTRVLCALNVKGQARDTRVHLPMVQQLVCPQTVVNHLEPWKLLSVLRQTKHNELNHYVALAESNIQRRACWVNPACKTRSERKTRSWPWLSRSHCTSELWWGWGGAVMGNICTRWRYGTCKHDSKVKLVYSQFRMRYMNAWTRRCSRTMGVCNLLWQCLMTLSHTFAHGAPHPFSRNCHA